MLGNMGVLSQFRTFQVVLPQARRNRSDLLRALAWRPQVLGAVWGYELALVLSTRVSSRLKTLAELKASTMISCEYCIDIG